jgi:hypothetical protein
MSSVSSHTKSVSGGRKAFGHSLVYACALGFSEEASSISIVDSCLTRLNLARAECGEAAERSEHHSKEAP